MTTSEFNKEIKDRLVSNYIFVESLNLTDSGELVLTIKKRKHFDHKVFCILRNIFQEYDDKVSIKSYSVYRNNELIGKRDEEELLNIRNGIGINTHFIYLVNIS